MKKIYRYLLAMLLVLAVLPLSAQQRRPIDSQHPLWMIHIDVWNSADPQKIIDLIPADIRPYVCMNLSLSCQFDTATGMYRMPRCAVRTYKSWASVCQQNGLWFSCQPASGGHTHIQDTDLETFEYFFKTYPNFLGWNYAEQFWAFGDAGDASSMTKASRWALFAKLVEMSHKYGGFLTVSWCGGIYHFDTDPIAELKTDPNFLAACKKYPESILFLYKYTHCSSFYNNESVCFGPFVSGLTKNYGVRYDNCGWNDMLAALFGGDNGRKYPGSAGIGTVMEQTCVNGGAVWDGPELIWTEDFKNTYDTTVDGYTRRNWTTFDNFNGIWLDMWRRIIDGTMYIPTREEVVAKTKVALVHDASNDFKVPDALYDGLYKVNDPGNIGDGRFENNKWYLKSTGRYGAIPMVTGMYDDAAKAIPVKVNKSAYSSRWSTQSKKVEEFNSLYPEVSKGDLYVNRYRNQLVTYTPYTYMNKKRYAQASIPLQYNTCDTLRLKYALLSSGVIREFSDHIEFYLNNYRSDSLTVRVDTIEVTGVKTDPVVTQKQTTYTTPNGYAASFTKNYDADKKTVTVYVTHMGAVSLTVNCEGDATDRLTDVLPVQKLTTPDKAAAVKDRIIIEAENLDRKNIQSVSLTHSGWWAQDMEEFAGMGYIQTGTNTQGSLRHQLKVTKTANYRIYVRYCGSSKAGNLSVNINGASTSKNIPIESVAKNKWKKASCTAQLKAGTNTLLFNNTAGINMYIDQIIYEPTSLEPEKFKVTVREADFGKVVADVDSAAEGQTVHLSIQPDEGYGIKELRVVNSVYFTMKKTIPVEPGVSTEASFVMPDDNYTIQPVFYDMTALYTMDLTTVANGAMPVGWRATQANNEVHQYPNTYSSGSRTMTGFAGHQGAGLYWRDNSADYGRQSSYLLTLEPGSYKLKFAMAAWKGTPQYNAQILKASTSSAIATSTTYTAAPNADGNNTASVASAVWREMPFEVTEAGNYVVKFNDQTTYGGLHEFLLLQCKVCAPVATGINVVDRETVRPAGIYSLSGIRRESLQPGLNIIISADGKMRKVLIRSATK